MNRLDFIAVSDLHIGRKIINEEKVEALFAYVIKQHPKYFILNGDILELLYKSKKDIFKNPLYQSLLEVAEKVNTIYIEGNHDPYKKIIKIKKQGKLPNITIIKERFYIEKYNLLFTHGNKFDTLQRHLDKYLGWTYPILPLVWKKALRPTPAQLKEAGKIEKYDLHVSFTHQTALNEANKNRFDISIGHTHRSQGLVDPTTNRRIYVTSAWDNEFIFLRGENSLIKLTKLSEI